MMHHLKIPFRKTKIFDEFFLKYVEENQSTRAFYNRFPHIESFQDQMLEKEGFPQSNRDTLAEELEKQYAGIEESASTIARNIQLLRSKNTFTITTGHQLNIFTGPLYFIYKIVTVINLAKKLKERHPEKDFIPIYWMASEDHDYEEIKAFALYGNSYCWETKQSGAVGRFHLKEMEHLLSQIPGNISIFTKAYSTSKSLSEAGRKYVNALFGEQGLLVLDADSRSLKKSLIPVMEMDIIQRGAFNIVSKVNAKMKEKGVEATVNPREINFFYLDKDLRSRIEKNGNQYIVVGTNIVFSEEELREQISTQYQKFSPNVIIRPVYQELILPNLAYIGGPSELAYWLQLKDLFDFLKIPFPILAPRNFALIVKKSQSEKIQKTGIAIENWFYGLDFVFDKWVKNNTRHNLSLDGYLKKFNNDFSDIEKICTDIDSSLQLTVRAEAQRMKKSLAQIEKKMLRSEKRLRSDRLRQMATIMAELFPRANLQERTDNFLNFYQRDNSFIKRMLEHLDPFERQFNVLTYDD